MKDDFYSKEDFFTVFEDLDFQAVNFKYKGVHYELSGFWYIGIYQDDESDSEDLGDFDSKYEALDARIFDNGTKSLRDIVEEITDISFN